MEGEPERARRAELALGANDHRDPALYVTFFGPLDGGALGFDAAGHRAYLRRRRLPGAQAQQRWRNKDAFRSRQTLLPRKIFRLDRDQSARGRGSGDEGRHSCGVCWACFASAVRRCSRRAAGKPADRGKFQSMLSREARGASNEPLLRLDAWMALIFSTWSFPAMAHRAPSDAFLVFTRPRPLDRDQRGRLTTA